MSLFNAFVNQSLNFMHKGVDSISKELLNQPVDHSYNASFGDYDDIISKHNEGFCIDGIRHLQVASPNSLVIGGSGTGKTSCIIIPHVLNIKNTNIFVNDNSKEIYNATCHYLLSQGYSVKVINFGDNTAPNGVCYNPLHYIENAADAQRIAFTLVKNELGNSKEEFWNIMATNLITLIIRVLLHYDKQYRNLANVSYLLQQLTFNPQLIDKLVAGTHSKELFALYKQYLSYDVKLRSSINATATSSLSLYNDPILASVTATDTLNIDQLRTEKVAIFIHCPLADASYFSGLISLFVSQMCKKLMREIPADNSRYIQFLLDEFSSLYIKDIQIILSNIRKYKINFMLMLQDFQQIEAVYGKQDAQAIKTNCIAKLYFAGMNYYNSKDLSDELGKFEFEHNGQHRIKELMTPDSLRMLSRDEAILLYGNAQPIKLTMTPYYENPFLQLRIKQPPVIVSTIDPLVKYIDEQF